MLSFLLFNLIDTFKQRYFEKVDGKRTPKALCLSM